MDEAILEIRQPTMSMQQHSHIACLALRRPALNSTPRLTRASLARGEMTWRA